MAYMLFFSPSLKMSLVYTIIYIVAKPVYIGHRYDLTNDLILT